MNGINYGKVYETYFEKDSNTSWLINELEDQKEDKYRYDTLKLVRAFSLSLPISNNSGEKECFWVSLYIKRDGDCNGDSLDTKLTFSKIKSICAEKAFDDIDVKDNLFLSSLFPKLDALIQEQEIIFERGLCFKAQGLSNWCEKGKTKKYQIVGICLERIL